MKTTTFSTIALLVCLATGALQPSCTPEDPMLVTGNMEGTVTDYETTQAIAGVMVDIVANASTTFAKQSRQTGNDGKFAFKDLEAGNYKLSFKRSGYQENNQDVTLVAGQTVSSDILLMPASPFKVTSGVLVNYSGTGGNVVIPDNLGITSIGDNVFQDNAALLSVVIPSGVINIGNEAFRNCSGLTFVTFPNTLKTIGNDAFYKCPLITSATIPNSVTSIGQYAFGFCSALSSVTIGSGVASIGGGAFAVCDRLTSFNVNIGNLSYVAEDGVIFNKTKTVLVVCPSGKQNYTIPTCVTDIGERAFYMGSLISVTIPNTVRNIGAYALSCSYLSDVTVSWTQPLNVSAVFNSGRESATLHVPAGTKTAYEAANVWKDFGTIVEY